MDTFAANTEDISEFGSRLSVVADTIAQALADVTAADHTGLADVLGLIGEDFIRVTGQARQTHIDDLDRLAGVVAGVAAATRGALDLYVDTDDAVRRTVVEAARA